MSVKGMRERILIFSRTRLSAASYSAVRLILRQNHDRWRTRGAMFQIYAEREMQRALESRYEPIAPLCANLIQEKKNSCSPFYECSSLFEFLRDVEARQEKFHSFIQWLGRLRLRRKDSKERALAMKKFCEESFSWVLARYSCQPNATLSLLRARALCTSVILVTSDIPDGRLSQSECPFLDYVRARISGEFVGPRHSYQEFDGLILDCAATYRGPVDWLGEDETTRNVRLMSSVYTSLRSNVFALRRLSSAGFIARAKLRESIFRAQIEEHGLTIESTNLESLKGCLVRTRCGSTIYLDDSLDVNDMESVAFHELGHFLLQHEPNLEYELDAGRIESGEHRDQFLMKEREAIGFAALRLHVLDKLMDYFETVLMQFVPPEHRSETIPCHHIPLNTSGETLDHLYRSSKPQEVEEAVGNRLGATIDPLEKERGILKLSRSASEI